MLFVKLYSTGLLKKQGSSVCASLSFLLAADGLELMTRARAWSSEMLRRTHCGSAKIDDHHTLEWACCAHMSRAPLHSHLPKRHIKI